MKLNAYLLVALSGVACSPALAAELNPMAAETGISYRGVYHEPVIPTCITVGTIVTGGVAGAALGTEAAAGTTVSASAICRDHNPKTGKFGSEYMVHFSNSAKTSKSAKKLLRQALLTTALVNATCTPAERPVDELCPSYAIRRASALTLYPAPLSALVEHELVTLKAEKIRFKGEHSKLQRRNGTRGKA